MQLVRVALAVPLMRLFDYLLPAEITPPVIGSRVLVPFNTQKKVGIVLDFPTQTDIAAEQLKPIIATLDEQSLFEAHQWQLLHWAAQYYQTPLGEALIQALPVKLRQGESAVEKAEIFWKITALGQHALTDGSLKRSKKQLEALTQLQESPLSKTDNSFTSVVWSALKEKNYITEFSQPSITQSWQQALNGQTIVNESNKLRLNKQQALVMSKLVFQQGFAAFLLEGVTGSGKTEIYLQLIEETLKKGKQVLVLVPEIGLTPQTVQRFQARFNVVIDVLHSDINDSQRLKAWNQARTGQSAVIIGTRSALFTPFSDLGLIVIDEEHDSSFKQQDGWRYHARDLAVYYAKLWNISIVMGSATPSLESLNNAKNGKYQHLVLSQRAGNGTNVRQQLIDLRQQRIHNGLSDLLLAKMTQHLEKGNQVLLFLNRRGFAPALLCHECGWMAQCSHCEKPYTYHQQQRILRCHHCHSQHRLPYQCPECGSTQLMTTGEGTEQLESVLQQRFPQYHITRIDRDSTARKGKLESHLQDIQQGKSQILIGTQMLAKGHHFPNVTLVALVNVDSALFSLDFRAEERLAQLYVQVAGRAGRAEKQGEVVLQTHYPDHPLLQSLLTDGYQSFAEQALAMRRAMGLPPFTAQALFKAQSRKSQEAEQTLQDILQFFTARQIQGLQLLGPMPAPHSKKAGQFRWQLLLQHQSKGVLQQVLTQYSQQKMPNHKVRLVLDVDPLDFS
ncbi:replication restart DNA helicase PriA [Cricetibacter osteomyelitidis]|uniref:Replication restart protein PriA n=1 Tax=Cricetibacter osteomyelitidis TaxID=1521931 RepID=A0A4R2TMT4_9PAST|nr:primosomal protein N' [Cricetibacter osteomyelitidis]TCP96242.1 replication restart DNA helicase PriA [Cricetibacter osteomyelitidis]